MSHYDLVLRGGRVVDPEQGIDAVLDVGFHAGAVSAVAESISIDNAAVVKDVTGMLVTPGLIDMHTHVYWGGTSLGIDAEAFCRRSAVTTAIDTGSAGPGNFAGFRSHVIEPSQVRILAFLHVSHAGIFGFSNRVMVGESEEVRLMDPKTAVEVINSNRDLIVGVKIRLGRWASGLQGMTPFQYAYQVADATGLPMMVHIDEPPPSYREVVESLRPGDILTHCFRPFPNTPIGGDEQILPEVLAARERGVYFDIGHGKGSFSFKVAKTMLEQGFMPDSISSDIHQLCIEGPVFDQVTTLSKFLNLGVSLNEVIKSTTQTAATMIGKPELGNLKVGSTGDAAVLKLDEGSFDFIDSTGESMQGSQRLLARGAVLGGQWMDPD